MTERNESPSDDDLLANHRELATAFDIRESEVERARIELILRPLPGGDQPAHGAT